MGKRNIGREVQCVCLDIREWVVGKTETAHYQPGAEFQAMDLEEFGREVKI